MRLRPWRELKSERDLTDSPIYWRAYAQECVRSMDDQMHRMAAVAKFLTEWREKFLGQDDPGDDELGEIIAQIDGRVEP